MKEKSGSKSYKHVLRTRNLGLRPVKIKVKAKDAEIKAIKEAVANVLKTERRKGNCEDGYMLKTKIYD